MPTPRPVAADETAELARLLGGVFGLDAHYPLDRMLADLKRPTVRRRSLVIAEDGQVVSHIRVIYDKVSVYGCELRTASIGCVATAEGYRNRGYAGAILETLLQEMERVGTHVLIVSGSRGLYRRVHCAPVGVVHEGVVRGGFAEPDRGLDVRRVGPEQWPAMSPLYQAESVRFVRPLDFLASRPFWWDDDYPELWLIERGGEPVAYLGLALSWPRDPERRSRVFWEYAGAREAVLGALPAIMEAGGLTDIRLRVLDHDREMTAMLQTRGIALEPGTLPGTHRIVDLPGLMRRLRPYLAARLGQEDIRRLAFAQEGDRCAVSLGEERMEMSLSQAAPLVLGGAGAPEASGKLGEVLGRIFPLPFPMPGFNYI